MALVLQAWHHLQRIPVEIISCVFSQPAMLQSTETLWVERNHKNIFLSSMDLVLWAWNHLLRIPVCTQRYLWVERNHKTFSVLHSSCFVSLKPSPERIPVLLLCWCVLTASHAAKHRDIVMKGRNHKTFSELHGWPCFASLKPSLQKEFQIFVLWQPCHKAQQQRPSDRRRRRRSRRSRSW